MRNDLEPSVLLVDDHDVFRQGLAKLLADDGFEIVGEAADGEEAVRLVRRLAPDVVVMDLRLPKLSGLEAIRRIAVEGPSTRVLVLTISADEEDVTEAVLAGASGYLLKDATIAQIVQGVRAAAIGESLISPKVAARLLGQIREAETASPVANGALSERELDVLRLVAEGKDNAEIGGQLFISPQTVKNHVSNILFKLQIENRIQAAVYAVRQGIV
jgi:two-component system NarL family response regulator